MLMAAPMMNSSYVQYNQLPSHYDEMMTTQKHIDRMHNLRAQDQMYSNDMQMKLAMHQPQVQQQFNQQYSVNNFKSPQFQQKGFNQMNMMGQEGQQQQQHVNHQNPMNTYNHNQNHNQQNFGNRGHCGGFHPHDQDMQDAFQMEEENQATNDLDNTNLYVKGLWKDCTQVELDDLFKDFGVISQSRVYGDGVGFVRFEQNHEATRAIESMNGSKPDQRCTEHLLVKRAFKKTRNPKRFIRVGDEVREVEMIMNKNTNNVYLRCLPKGFVENDLIDLCSQYGDLTCTRLRESGVAFVRYRLASDAQKAIRELNGQAFANQKERLLAKLANSDPFQPKIGFRQRQYEEEQAALKAAAEQQAKNREREKQSKYHSSQQMKQHQLQSEQAAQYQEQQRMELQRQQMELHQRRQLQQQLQQQQQMYMQQNSPNVFSNAGIAQFQTQQQQQQQQQGASQEMSSFPTQQQVNPAVTPSSQGVRVQTPNNFQQFLAQPQQLETPTAIGVALQTQASHSQPTLHAGNVPNPIQIHAPYASGGVTPAGSTPFSASWLPNGWNITTPNFPATPGIQSSHFTQNLQKHNWTGGGSSIHRSDAFLAQPKLALPSNNDFNKSPLVAGQMANLTTPVMAAGSEAQLELMQNLMAQATMQVTTIPETTTDAAKEPAKDAGVEITKVGQKGIPIKKLQNPNNFANGSIFGGAAFSPVQSTLYTPNPTDMATPLSQPYLRNQQAHLNAATTAWVRTASASVIEAAGKEKKAQGMTAHDATTTSTVGAGGDSKISSGSVSSRTSSASKPMAMKTQVNPHGVSRDTTTKIYLVVKGMYPESGAEKFEKLTGLFLKEHNEKQCLELLETQKTDTRLRDKIMELNNNNKTKKSNDAPTSQ